MSSSPVPKQRFAFKTQSRESKSAHLTQELHVTETPDTVDAKGKIVPGKQYAYTTLLDDRLNEVVRLNLTEQEIALLKDFLTAFKSRMMTQAEVEEIP